MRCYSTISIQRPGGSSSADRITVPCGRCFACLANKRKEWSFRLNEELKRSSSAFFITLTYDEINLPINEYGNPTVIKTDCQKFMKRLRKSSQNKLRYFLVSEYGSRTFRPHYHCILFNIEVNIASTLIQNAWSLGQIHVGKVTPASINYVTKYCIAKSSEEEGREKTFALMSTRPGIGSNYLDRCRNWHEEDPNRFYAVSDEGFKVNLPRYYKEKIYSKETREHHTAIAQGKLSVKSKLTQDQFEKAYPNENYYRYQLDLINNFERVMKDQIDKNSKKI